MLSANWLSILRKLNAKSVVGKNQEATWIGFKTWKLRNWKWSKGGTEDMRIGQKSLQKVIRFPSPPWQKTGGLILWTEQDQALSSVAPPYWKRSDGYVYWIWGRRPYPTCFPESHSVCPSRQEECSLSRSHKWKNTNIRNLVVFQRNSQFTFSESQLLQTQTFHLTFSLHCGMWAGQPGVTRYSQRACDGDRQKQIGKRYHLYLRFAVFMWVPGT